MKRTMITEKSIGEEEGEHKKDDQRVCESFSVNRY